MPSALLLATAILASAPDAQTAARLNLLLSGGKVGDVVYQGRADGPFTSTMNLAVAGVTVKSDLQGKLAPDGSILEYTVDQVHSVAGTVRFALKNGKLKGTAGGKTGDVPYNFKGKATFSNFHPQVTASALKEVKWEIGKAQKITAFIYDGGGAPEITITPTGEKTSPAGTARLYHLKLANVELDMAMTEAGIVVGEDVPTQKLRFVADGWESLFADPLANYPELSQPTFKTVVERGVKMRTRDGVELVADIARPDGPGKYPAILVRTPYGRSTETIEAEKYARRGYVYIAQDCRGRNDSGGAWDPFVHEVNDGTDTLDWIARQPWSDGKVGMIGASYGGSVQWAAAMGKHPALKCIVPQVSPPDAMRNLPYDHGVFFLFGNLWWARIVADKKADMAATRQNVPNLDKMNTLPLSKVDDAVFGKNYPFFDQWLDRYRLRDWKGFDFTWHLREIDVPALHISGWWDGDGIGTKLNWAEMRAAGRKNQWLIYGPWTHAFNTTRKLGDVDYGDKAILELDSLYLRWFDTWLKGKDVGMSKVPKVQVFVTGANRWVPLPDWPSPNAPVTTLYLASGGRLLDKVQAKDRPSKYTYDPAKDKIPAGLKDATPGEGSTNLSEVKLRKDTLIFRSNPLPRPTAISGPLEVNLSFRTSARDTDLFAMLVDILPNGEMRAFGQSGKLRASYLTGMDNPQPLTPNRIYAAKIEPWDTAHELKAGHRLGLIVHSSSFPIYARNLGTGEPIKSATRMIVQHNTILHDAKNPSTVKFRTLW